MYNQRVKVFLAMVGVVFGVLIGRLAHLQLVRGQEFRREILRRNWREVSLPAARGQILDRHGAILAVDEPCFDLCVDYRLLFHWVQPDPSDPARRAFARKVAWWLRRQRRALLASLALPPGEYDARQLQTFGRERLEERMDNTWRLLCDLAGSAEAATETVRAIVSRVEHLRDVSTHKNPLEQFQDHAVVSGLDEATAVALKERLDEMVGVTVRPSFQRRYPYKSLACHVVGLTGEVTAAEIDNGPADNPYREGDIIGKIGVERMCERQLRGRRGQQCVHRMTGKLLDETPAEHGHDVTLTLDVALQAELTALMPPGTGGCIVVLSVPDGQVLAMVSLPGYDVNRYRTDFEKLVRDDVFFPLRHRAVSRLYPPGSTAKPLAAVAGLGSGAITPTTVFHCDGYFNPDDPTRFRCWTVQRGLAGHGPMTVVDALKHSCNVFFYHVGQETGGVGLAEWYALFGFLDPPGLGLPEERAGVVSSNVSVGESRLMAIGQGPVAVTPLHVANAMATLARDGVFLPPTLLLDDPRERPTRRLPLEQALLALVRRGMHKVVDEPGGTAYRAFHGGDFEPLGVTVCGKTGTATVPPRVSSSGRRLEGNMAWFAGFAPYEDPQIAFAVVVEYVEGGGSSDAAPIGREAIRACIRRGYVKEAR